MSGVFTKIVKGEIPSYKVAETENCYAFLDINPLSKGHTLVIPKLEVDYIFDLEDSLYLELMQFAKKVAKAIDMVIPSLKVGIAVIGLEVPHAHIHLVPQHAMGTLNFANEKLVLEKGELDDIAAQIQSAFQKI